MITLTEMELYVRIKPYYKFVELVSSTMPDMAELSSTMILAETNVNMNFFEDKKSVFLVQAFSHQQ